MIILLYTRVLGGDPDGNKFQTEGISDEGKFQTIKQKNTEPHKFNIILFDYPKLPPTGIPPQSTIFGNCSSPVGSVCTVRRGPISVPALLLISRIKE